MNAVLNGRVESFSSAPTIRRLVEESGHDPRGMGVAVALNGEVLPRGMWDGTTIEDGDRVEILVATQGG